MICLGHGYENVKYDITPLVQIRLYVCSFFPFMISYNQNFIYLIEDRLQLIIFYHFNLINKHLNKK